MIKINIPVFEIIKDEKLPEDLIFSGSVLY